MIPLSLTPHSSFLIQKKNLLAFSGGIDSSALFFLLIEHDIPFDIAIVDYGLRAESREEIAHAKALAERYELRCYTVQAPHFKSHFEQQARAFRYRFFENLIQEHGYDTLLTAHQLNDQLEWLLMRLGRGAGVSELIGLAPVSQREGYTLVRPLLEYSKEELLEYLQAHNYPYFIDSSNSDERYERNYFRKQFSDPLLAAHKEGIRQSMRYLREDKQRLEADFETLYRDKALYIITLHHPQAKAKAADQTLKKLGYLLTAAQRKEIAKEQSLVIGGVWAIEEQQGLLYIAPYRTADMPKSFKEQCRIAKIPAKIRPYLYVEKITLP